MDRPKKEIKEEPWNGLSLNLVVQAFLEKYPNSVVSDLAKYFPLHDAIRIIYYCSGQLIWIGKDGTLRKQLKDKISPDSYNNFFKWYKGKRIYIPEYKVVENCYRNSLIFKALKRDNSLRNRQRISEKFKIAMRQLARIYRQGKQGDVRKREQKDREELEKALQK